MGLLYALRDYFHKDVTITGLEYGKLGTFLETTSIAGANVSQSSDRKTTIKESEMSGINPTMDQYRAL